LTLRYPYTPTYEIQVDVSGFPYAGSCAGLIANGQSGPQGSAIEFVECFDEVWSIFSVKSDGTVLKRLALGAASPQNTYDYHLTIKALANEDQFFINGRVVKTIATQQTGGTTDFTGVCLTYDEQAYGFIGADIANFTYQPIN
jgi:hypothetical protein